MKLTPVKTGEIWSFFFPAELESHWVENEQFLILKCNLFINYRRTTLGFCVDTQPITNQINILGVSDSG